MIHSPPPRRLLVAAGLLCLWLARPAAAGAQDAPLVVEGDVVTYDQGAQSVEASGHVRLRWRGIRLTADRVTFDLAREFLTAEGGVVLVDASGRELRGSALRYDVRLGLAEVREAEVTVDRLFLRSELLQARPGALTASEAMVTPCDPARPAARITARRIELRPGDRLVATQASLWVGSRRLLTLPVYTLSLGTPEATALSFPRAGYSTADGAWNQYVQGYRLGTVDGALALKYGVRSGLIAHNTLTYRRMPFSLALTVGRDQDIDLRVYDQAEVTFALAEQPLGGGPVLASLEVRHGWFDEATTGLATSRTRYALGIRVPEVALTPALRLRATASWSDAVYGTGDRQGVIRGRLALRHALDDRRSIALTHEVYEVVGVTPFLLDAVDPLDLVDRTVARYTQTGARGDVGTAFTTGAGYDFRARSPLLIVGYGEQRPGRSHWHLAAEYTIQTADTRLAVGVGQALGSGTYAAIQAVYRTAAGTFEDLDLVVTSRLCDCFDAALIYRSVRRQIWVEVGLTAPTPPWLKPFIPEP